MENTASLGFSSFAVIDFPLSQRLFVLFKSLFAFPRSHKIPAFFLRMSFGVKRWSYG